MLVFVLFLLILLSLVHYYFYETKFGQKLKNIPGPKLLPLIGNALYFLCNPIQLFSRERRLANIYQNTYGVCRLWILNDATVNLYDPDDIEILLSNPKHISKGMVYTFLHPWLNSGLLTSTGEKWQTRRKILTPTFHFNILRQFCKIFIDQSHKLIEKLNSETEKCETSLLPFITDFALQTISETAMGYNLESNLDKSTEYKRAIYRMGEVILERASRPWLHPDFIYYKTSTGKEEKKLLSILHQFTLDVIRNRRETWKDDIEELELEDSIGVKKRLAMLDLLLKAEFQGQITEFGIREEVDTFMFEGHDTTTIGITFCLMLLANNPNIQERVVAEIHDVLHDNESLLTMEHLNKMTYLEMCLKESLRLYPSVPFISRRLQDDLHLKNYVVPAGTNCDIHIYDVHRNPRLFSDPDKFDPERFSLENSRNRHPYAYIPFSAGSRNCIGQRFALLEEKIVISRILKNFVLKPITKPEDIFFTTDIVLRCKDPVKVKFVRRH